jgi:class 3 adenylate cyclase
MSSGEALTTIVFVDVVGSTDLVDRLGDDLGTSAVNRQLGIVRERLSAHDGRQVKSLGDGLLLTFRSARQAIAFGLACQRAVGSSAPPIRIGINTGDVVDLDVDPVGGVVNAASRIADRAEAGEVLVADVVRQLAGSTPVVRYVDRGRVRLKGFAEPRQLWAAVEQGSVRGRRVTIGRLGELEVLNEMLSALTAGSGRAELFVGEAGIGKSHLLDVLGEHARAAGMTVLEVVADDVAHRPGHIAHLLADDERLPRDHRSKLHVLLEPSRREDEPADRSFAVIEASGDALEVLTRVGPVVLVAEDLHWADDLSLGVLRGVIRRTSSAPIGVIGAFRPVPRPPLLDRVIDATIEVGGRHLSLDPLDEIDVQTLSAVLIGAAPGAALRERLRSAGGNPLFVSELIRSCDEEEQIRIEGGVAEISDVAAPASLGATWLRRLSWLPDGTRDVLRLASLLGTNFTLNRARLRHHSRDTLPVAKRVQEKSYGRR